MLPVNFFESTLHFNIRLLHAGHVEVEYRGKVLFSGIREFCFKKIEEMVYELDGLGRKELYFHIQNLTSVGDSAYRYDGIYFKEHLSVLKAKVKSYLEIKSGLYNVFA